MELAFTIKRLKDKWHLKSDTMFDIPKHTSFHQTAVLVGLKTLLLDIFFTFCMVLPEILS